MHNIKGNDPLKISGRLISGDIPLITYKFSPTGGVINPISILIVNTTANQIGSKPAPSIIGNNIGVVIKIIATGGKKKPATSKKILIINNNTHLLTDRSAIT